LNFFKFPSPDAEPDASALRTSPVQPRPLRRPGLPTATNTLAVLAEPPSTPPAPARRQLRPRGPPGTPAVAEPFPSTPAAPAVAETSASSTRGRSNAARTKSATSSHPTASTPGPSAPRERKGARKSAKEPAAGSAKTPPKIGRPWGSGVGDFASEKYRLEELAAFFHRYRHFSFKTRTGKDEVDKVARIVAEDMTEKFTMGVYIPRNAEINFRG